MGDEDRKSKGTSTLGSLLFLGLGAAVEEEKKKEQMASNQPMPQKPKTCKFEDTCVICLCKFSEDKKNIILDCTHTFHLECVKKLVHKKCPTCRRSFA